MKKLIFDIEKKLDTSNFNRIGDLSYFEGPLLSLFKDIISGHFYIFDWVDRDSRFNRWLIYRVAPKYVLQFLNREISHLELFQTRPNQAIYFTDIEGFDSGFFHYSAFQIETLPDSYLPNEDNIFDPADCDAEAKIKLVVKDSLSRQKYENEYSRTYQVTVLKQNEGRITFFNRIPDDFSMRSLYHFFIKRPIVLKEKRGCFDSYILSDSETRNYSNIKKTKPIKREEYANRYD